MVTKKVRTEYMKKFKDPKWETFSRLYEDSLRYRLSRRLMEGAHRPWFWEGWDSGSDSSGWSTPRPARNRVAPLSLPAPPSCAEVKQKLLDLKPEPGGREGKETERETGEAAGGAEQAVVVNGVDSSGSGGGGAAASGAAAPNVSSAPDETATDNGPADSASSDGERPNPPPPPRRHRCHHRVPRSDPALCDGSHDDRPNSSNKKQQRAKSQPPSGGKEGRRASSRLDWTERITESRTFDAAVQARREPSKRGSNLDRRRARSADLEKMRRTQLAVVDDRWMTEYMRCFSARVR